MLQSRNALGNLIARYTSVLTKCRMLNVLGTCALATALAIPSVAMAGTVETEAPYGVLIDDDVTVWDSSANIEKTDFSNVNAPFFYGVTAWDVPSFEPQPLSLLDDSPMPKPDGDAPQVADSITMTLQSGHKIILTAPEDRSINLTGMYAEREKNTIINNGTIELSTSGGGNLYGMDAWGFQNTVTNLADITVTAEGSMAIATGMLADASYMSGPIVAPVSSSDDDAPESVMPEFFTTFTNSGTMTVTAGNEEVTEQATATGMHVGSVIVFFPSEFNGPVTLTNSGTMNVTAEGSAQATATGMLAGSGMWGSSTYFGDSVTLTNSGSMTVKAVGNSAIATGMQTSIPSIMVDLGSVPDSPTADDMPEPIFIEINTSLTNSGTMNVTAEGYDAMATGMHSGAMICTASQPLPVSSDDGNDVMPTELETITSLTNSGTMTIMAGNEDTTEAMATGMHVGSSIMDNSGMAGNPTVPTSVMSTSSEFDYSIFFSPVSLANSGSMTVTAEGDEAMATGMHVGSSMMDSPSVFVAPVDLINSGTMEIKAEGDTATATGMQVGSGVGVDSSTFGNFVSLTNSGTMTVTAEGDAALATGMNVGSAVHAGSGMMGATSMFNGPVELSNTGTIKVSAESSTNAQAMGIMVRTAVPSQVRVASTQANADPSSGPSIFDFSADSLEALSPDMFTDLSDDIDADLFTSTISNSGTLEVAAKTIQGTTPVSNPDPAPAPAPVEITATSVGIAVMGELNAINNEESGVINVIADGGSDATGASAVGMYAIDSTMGSSGFSTNVLFNAGTIKVESIGSNYTTGMSTYGMLAQDSVNNLLVNTGNVEAKATGDKVDVSGMEAQGNNNILVNNGTVTTFASGDMAYATGMSATDQGIGFLANFNTINATAESAGDMASAIGMYAINGTAIVINKGVINVSATQNGSKKADAYGMYIGIGDDNGTGDVSNKVIANLGTINVAATGDDACAYQAYVANGTANVATWTMTLGEAYGEKGLGYHVFGTAGDATVHFGIPNSGTDEATGANLIISGTVEGFQSGTICKVSDLVDGNASGYIESVSSAFNFLQVELVELEDDASTSIPTTIGTPATSPAAPSYKDQGIKGTLVVSSENSPVHAAANLAVGGAKGHMNNVSKIVGGQRGFGGHGAGRNGAGGRGPAQGNTPEAFNSATMYADAGTSFTDAGNSYVSQDSPVWNAFLMPFYSKTSENGGAYDTNVGGLVVGANRDICDDFSFGFHASISKAKSDSDYTDSDALSYALGVNGVYNVDDSLYFRGQLTGFFAENDLDMVSSTGALAQTASADMDTYGFFTEIAAGYDIALAQQHVVTPELALSYMYAHMDGFDATFRGAGVPTAFSMDSENYDALYADASVRWVGTFDVTKGTLKPTVKAGIRQALTDPETSATMNIFGQSATTHSDANETAFTCEAGLAWEMDEVTISATYTGEFGDVEYSHMGMFKVEWSF